MATTGVSQWSVLLKKIKGESHWTVVYKSVCRKGEIKMKVLNTYNDLLGMNERYMRVFGVTRGHGPGKRQ